MFGLRVVIVRVGRDWSDAIELTDWIVSIDPVSLERRPVRVSDVEEIVSAAGDRVALRLLHGLPSTSGVLDEGLVDDLLVRVHSELSRLGQEFAQPMRLRSLLAPIVEEIRHLQPGVPIRVVDVGCGLGYAIRWLARYGDLGDDVELIGCDLNLSLITEARRLAALDCVRCRFEAADAFRLDEPATIVTSSGVVHHFRDSNLEEFFASHDSSTVRAFVHFDVTPAHAWLRYIGAWVFHRSRMREPLSRHDGLVSAMRAHDDRTLATAAARGADWADVAIYGPVGCGSAFVNVMRPVIGLAPDLVPAVTDRLGPKASRLHGLDQLP